MWHNRKSEHRLVPRFHILIVPDKLKTAINPLIINEGLWNFEDELSGIALCHKWFDSLIRDYVIYDGSYKLLNRLE